jgi:hypothetical protein
MFLCNLQRILVKYIISLGFCIPDFFSIQPAGCFSSFQQDVSVLLKALFFFFFIRDQKDDFQKMLQVENNTKI